MDIDQVIAGDAWLQAMENLYGREYVEQLIQGVDEGRRKQDDDEAPPEQAMHNYELEKSEGQQAVI